VGSSPAVRTNMDLLKANNLHLWRGDLHVLRGLSFGLEAGRCLQVTGINGAGKSSLLRVLAGLLPLEEGTITWRGQDTQQDRLAFHAEVAWLSHGTALKGDLSARENLRFSAGLRRAVTEAEIEAALESVGFMHADHRLARQMSAGQQRRVALARVLLYDCALWMLDEPTSNLDTRGQDMFCRLLAGHLQRGGLAVVATHQALSLGQGQLQEMELS